MWLCLQVALVEGAYQGNLRALRGEWINELHALQVRAHQGIAHIF